MKKKLFFAFVLMGTNFVSIYAQSFQPTVIGSSGTFATSLSGSMSWTVGEVMTETYSPTNNFFTQGFHQPFPLLATIITNPVVPNIVVYPNPITDNLIIDLSNQKGNFNIEIFDMQGKLLRTETFSSGNTLINISFHEFANGTYLLNIINFNTNIFSSYKINKSE